MTSICYILVYIFETLISYIYYNNKFPKTKSNKYLLFSYICMFLIQYLCNFIGTPNFNLIIFFITNCIICFLCYKSNILQALFNSFILSAIMLTTELCIFYLSKLSFNTNITDYTSNDTVLFIQGASSKLLYFFIAYIISKISTKEKKVDLKFTKTSILFILPIASIVLLMGIAYITENYSTNNYLYILFSVATILLMYSNIVVFWVHESIIKTQYQNIELQLQQQKSEIDTEYYSILQDQYENSNILIHDIKRHLLSIKELSIDMDCKGINKYIDNLYDEYQIKYLKKYSDNKLINAIINRYVMSYKENNIDFYCDIRDIDFSFISDNNLTSILDNLLENALEASKNSAQKSIELTIKPANINFIAITIWNYCSNVPNIKNGKLITTKKNKSIHGFGIKGIERIAKEYNGNIDYSFDSETMIFTFKIILRTK